MMMMMVRNVFCFSPYPPPFFLLLIIIKGVRGCLHPSGRQPGPVYCNGLLGVVVVVVRKGRKGRRRDPKEKALLTH